MSIPSFCIPHMMSFVTDEKVMDVFNELFGCDCVENVQMVHMEKNGKKYQMCFVHFYDMYVDPEMGGGKWSKLDGPQAFFKLAPDQNKINPSTGQPYYWKVFLNKTPKNKPVILD